MSKLNNFKIEIETGNQGMDSPVKFAVNGFSIAFENGQGSVGPGGTFEASYEVNSFPHSLTLEGPEKGVWDIKKIAVEYQCEGLDLYSALLGEVTLDEKTEVNIWKEPPLSSFDV